MRAFAEEGFIQGFQDERHACLNDFVPAGRDAKGTLFSILLRNVDPSHGLRLVCALAQLSAQLKNLLYTDIFHAFPIYPRRLCAFVACYPFSGQCQQTALPHQAV